MEWWRRDRVSALFGPGLVVSGFEELELGLGILGGGGGLVSGLFLRPAGGIGGACTACNSPAAFFVRGMTLAGCNFAGA